MGAGHSTDLSATSDEASGVQFYRVLFLPGELAFYIMGCMLGTKEKNFLLRRSKMENSKRNQFNSTVNHDMN